MRTEIFTAPSSPHSLLPGNPTVPQPAVHTTGSQKPIQALRCKNPQCPKRYFDYLMSGCMLGACLWLGLDSECKIKYLNHNRSKWTNSLPSGDWAQPCISPTSREPMGWPEDRWDTWVCPHTKPHGELHLGREQIQRPCLCTPLWMQRGRKKASEKDIQHFQPLCHHFYFLHKVNAVAVNHLGNGRFGPYSPCCHQHPIPHRIALCNPGELLIMLCLLFGVAYLPLFR